MKNKILIVLIFIYYKKMSSFNKKEGSILIFALLYLAVAVLGAFYYDSYTQILISSGFIGLVYVQIIVLVSFLILLVINIYKSYYDENDWFLPSLTFLLFIGVSLIIISSYSHMLAVLYLDKNPKTKFYNRILFWFSVNLMFALLVSFAIMIYYNKEDIKED